MSHITKIKTVIKSLSAVEAACKKIGLHFVKGQKNYQWFGRWVGDSELPEGVEIKDLGTCDHAIKVPGASYEIGLRKHKDGYQVLYDSWGSGGLSKKKVNKFQQAYSVEAVKEQAKKKGMRVTEKKGKNDSIQLELVPIGG